MKAERRLCRGELSGRERMRFSDAVSCRRRRSVSEEHMVSLSSTRSEVVWNAPVMYRSAVAYTVSSFRRCDFAADPQTSLAYSRLGRMKAL